MASFEQAIKQLERASAAIERAQKESIIAAGERMKVIHEEVVTGTLHGPQFRRWNVPLVATAKPFEGGIRFAPVGRAAGPERVAQSGRHVGVAGPMHGPALAGFTKKGKQRKVKGQGHWNGSTAPKFTWTDTATEFNATIPPTLAPPVVAAFREVFG